MKIAVFCISRTKQNYSKLSTASESTLKVSVMLCWTLFKVLLMPGVTCKQILLHVNQFVKHIWNYYNENATTSIKVIFHKYLEKIYPKTAFTFFTGRSIFSYF